MFDISVVRKDSKAAMYQDMEDFVVGLFHEERDAIANMSNLASLLYHIMPDINWAGFYLYKEEMLVLGPFQGKPACIRIALGKGVCGTAASDRETQLVRDVHSFKGHIACDSDTSSEIVIPMIKEGRLIGVLDIDSPVAARFDKKDQEALERFTQLLMDACDI